MKIPGTTTRYRWIGWVVLLIPVLWAAALAAPAFFPGQPLSIFLDKLESCFNNPFSLIWTTQTLRIFFISIIAYGLGVGIYYATRKNTRHGEEHGSAIWGEVKTLCRKYRDKQYQNNILFTQDFRMGFDSRRHRRNLNVLVVGGSGSGKTRFYCKPSAPVRAAH